ncbi:MAG: 1-deoxy-D-xylulose-5-phosphate reductoisomerase [Fibrobacteres bacterium]|nr:1-deoxy-D-xylulose-5-phosphate reductoisomerase [Fibrobacterota bacterium]
MEKKNIALLGATGSIGMASLKVFRQHPERFRLVAVAAGRQWDKLLPVINEFKVEKVCLWDAAAAAEMRKHTSATVLEGMEGLLELVSLREVDYVLNGLVGAIGCRPTLEAISHGKHVGLANKETMVMAGEIINEALRRNPSSRLIPIDSEHSAIFQCLAGRPVSEVEQIQLTASGGPFRERPMAAFESIRKADALKHPTWVMGEKITIDSATLMNKGLEVIEAHYLFNVAMKDIKVVVHPASIIHSFVQFRDGSLMAQLGCPDMQLPIQYALTFPERWPLQVERLDMTRIGKLEFFPPDLDKFPCLALAYRAGNLGGTAPAILNAANEAAVARFLGETLAFTDIPRVIEAVLDEAEIIPKPTLENVIEADAWARQAATRIISALPPHSPALAIDGVPTAVPAATAGSAASAAPSRQSTAKAAKR